MQIAVADLITQFDPAEWNRLFPGELEDWAYYHATESAGLAGFEWLYFGVHRDGELCAAIPAFISDYRLDTTLAGRMRSVVGTLTRAVPGLLRPRMLSLGSPVSEICHAGFAPGSSLEDRTQWLALILDACQTEAERRGARLFAIKDLDAAQSTQFEPLFVAKGLRSQPGLATASLALPHASFDGYLAGLSRATRKDLRRKLRARDRLRIEWRSSLDGIDEAVAILYRNTLERADMQLEELSPAYFRNVLAQLPGRASCVCYWFDETLVAFNLVLHDSDRLIDKYIGLDYRYARELNLYFVSWMENVRYAIAHRIQIYQSGQGLPNEKLRLGSTLSPNWLWYRHRNRLIDGTMKAAEHALGLHRKSTPTLAAKSA